MSVPYGIYYSPDRILAEIRYQDKRSKALDISNEMITSQLSTVFRPNEDPSGMFTDRLTPGRLPPEVDFRRDLGPYSNLPGDVILGRAPGEPAIERGADILGLEQLERSTFGPLAAAGLQTVESPAFAAANPGMALAANLPRVVAEQLGVEEFVPGIKTQLREPGELVNPGLTIFGSESEQKKAQEVLEEAGFATEMAARMVFDPLNVIPGVGFSKVDDILRLLKLGSKARGASRSKHVADIVQMYQSDIKATRAPEALRADVAPTGVDVTGTGAADIISPERIPATVALPEKEVARAGRLPRSPLAAARKVNDLIASKITGGIPEGQLPLPKRDLKPGAVVRGTTSTGEAVEGTVAAVGARRVSVRTVDGSILPMTRESAEIITKAPSPSLGERIKGVARGTLKGVTQPGAIAPLDPSVVKFNKLMSTAKPTSRAVVAEQAAARARRTPGVAEALEDIEVSTREALIRGRQAQAGPLLPEGKPQFEVDLPGGRGTIEGAFTPEELENFVNLARFSPALENVPHTRLNIIESLIGSPEKKGILMGRLPTMGEIKLIEKVYGPEFAGNLARMRPLGEKFWNGFLDFANVPRTILASMDFSFPFRQGVFTTVRHPKEFFGNLPAMVRAARDPEFAQAVTDAIRNNKRLVPTAEGPRPIGQLIDEAEVFVADPAGIAEFSGREEQFLSAIAERFPGVQFSQRAFIVYGNKLRADIFENAIKSMSGPANRNPLTTAEIKDLGTLVNVLTGRGTLPPELAKALSFGFFAPRFAVSRPQFVLGALLGQVPGVRKVLPIIGAPGTTARVAHLAGQELVSSVATGMGILSLLSLSGAAIVELDPRSSDFGKFKVGKQRFDFWGGARPWATLIARMITGQRKTSGGFIMPADIGSELLTTGRSKLSPPGTLVGDAIAGETAIGEDFPRAPLTELRERTLFMAWQDIWESSKQEGVKGGFLAGALAPVGVGVQTYETPSERRKRIWEAETQEEWQKTADQWRIANEIADSGNEEFQEAFAPTPEMMETDEIRTSEASEMDLFSLARGITQGHPNAGPEFVETYEDFLDRISGAIYEDIFGKDSTASPEYQVWKDIKPVRDPDTFEIDYDSYFLQKDAAFDKLDPRLQKALEKHDAPGDDPVLQAVVDDFYVARDVRRGFYDIPKYNDLSAKDGDELDEFLFSTIEEFKRRWLRESGTTLDSLTAMLIAAEESGLSEELLGTAILLSLRGMRDLVISPKRDRYIIRNQDILSVYFPDLLEQQLSREQEVELSEPAFEAIAAR